METQHNQRLTPNELLAHGQQLLSRKVASQPLLLTIGLNRSDQLQALARDPHANLVLGEIIKRISKRLRAEDRVATAAFDEIWILIANVPNEAVATTIATAFREALYVPIHIPLQNAQTLTAQLQPVIGGAWSRSSTVSIGGLLQGAWDARQLASEREERLLVQCIGADDNAARMAEIETALRRHLFSNDLEVHFQPQIDLALPPRSPRPARPGACRPTGCCSN